jgi:hypothetical protein
MDFHSRLYLAAAKVKPGNVAALNLETTIDGTVGRIES